jgi:amino acid transporter
MESPIRAMFSEVPEGTFPKFLTKKQEDGTLKNALWVQCIIVLILIVVPLVGLNSIDSFFQLLTNLSALSLIIPYIILAIAYLKFRLNGNTPPFTMFKSKKSVILVSAMVFILGIAAFFGAGMDSVSQAKTVSEAVKSIVMTYGGPIILILLGYLIVFINKLTFKAEKDIDNSKSA